MCETVCKTVNFLFPQLTWCKIVEWFAGCSSLFLI